MNAAPLMAAPAAAAVFAQAGGGTGSFDIIQAIGSIGVGAVLAVPFVIVWRIAMARIHDLEEEVRTLNDDRLASVRAQVTRERELANSMVPLLQQAAEALRETPQVFDRAIEKVQGNVQRNESDLRLRQIELTMDAIVKRFEVKE